MRRWGTADAFNHCRACNRRPKGKWYKVRVTQTGHTIIRMKKYVKATSITVKEYHSNKMSQANRKQIDNKLNELIYHFPQLYKHEQLNKMKIEGKDTHCQEQYSHQGM